MTPISMFPREENLHAMERMYLGRVLGSTHAHDPQHSPLKLNYDLENPVQLQ